MPSFIDMLTEISVIANGMSLNWDKLFATDELVNEAWIRSLKTNDYIPSYILRRARFNMIEYIREMMGREYLYVDGKKIKKKKKNMKPKHITGFQSDQEDTHDNGFFDRPVEDRGLLSLENKEILQLILAEPTKKQLDAILMYYFSPHDMKTTGKILGCAECTVHGRIAHGFHKARKSPKGMELVELMECAKI